MERVVVKPAGMTPSRSPLSVAVRANGLIFCSGQLPVDPQTGNVVSGDIQHQTRRVLENLKLVLNAANSSLERAVKVTIYMTDLSGFGAMNEVYKEFFLADFPARTTVGVAGLARKDCLLEIDVVALEST